MAPPRVRLAEMRILTKKSFAVSLCRVPLAAAIQLIMSLKKMMPKVIISPRTQFLTTWVLLMLVLRRSRGSGRRCWGPMHFLLTACRTRYAELCAPQILRCCRALLLVTWRHPSGM